MTAFAPRPCAYVRCGVMFTPTRANQKHHTRKCGTLAYEALPAAEKRARRKTKAKRHPRAKYVYTALADVPPGYCPWGCEKPLPPRCRTRCKDPRCHAAYFRSYKAGQREVLRAEGKRAV